MPDWLVGIGLAGIAIAALQALWKLLVGFLGVLHAGER
jgi:hypothetical protein